MRRTTFCALALLALTLLPQMHGTVALGAAVEEGDTDGVATDPRVAEAIQLLEVWLEAKREFERIPGMSVAIIHDQEVVWTRGFGFADREARQPATPQTLYSICSISKLFTSVAVMQQRDAGKLRLDDPVSSLVPWFEIEQAHASAGPATVQGILTHSAGLPRESAHSYWDGPEFAFPSRDEIIATVASQATLYPADTYFQYSNLGLTLAGEIVAQTSGQPYAEYVRANILEPLGMSSTYPEIPVQLSGEALAIGYGPHRRQGERVRMEPFEARGIAPAAGYASSVEDMAKFASWQLRLLAADEPEVLAPTTLREMHRVHWVDEDWGIHWGLGFAVSRARDQTFVRHGGSCPGFRSEFRLQPRSRVGVVVMTNAMGVSPGLMADRAHQIVGPAIAAAIKSPDDAEAPDAELDRYIGIYRTYWGESAIIRWKGDLAEVSLPTNDPLDGITRLRHVDGHTFARIRSNDEDGETWDFEVDDAGEVIGLRQHGNFAVRVR